MICPHCGKTTPNAEQCMYCKMPTEFARRTDFQTVGSSRNQIEKSWTVQFPEPPVPAPSPVPESRQDGKKQALLAGLMALCFVAGAGVSWIVHDLVEPKSAEIVIVSGEQELPVPTGEPIPAATESQTQTLEEDPVATGSQIQTQEEDPAADAPIVSGEEDIDRNSLKISFDLNLQEAFTEPGDAERIPDPILWGEEVPYFYDLREWQFMGWNTEPDGTGITVSEGEIFELPILNNITLYAQWGPKIWDDRDGLRITGDIEI